MNASKMTFALGLAAAVTLAGCPVDHAHGPSLDQSNSGMVQGKVTPSAADDTSGSASTQSTADEGVGGAVVYAAQVETDGSLKVVSDQTEANASGQFSLRVPANLSNLVLVATKDSAKYQVILCQAVQAGSETATKPMTTESSVEARVFAKMVAKGASAAAVDTIDLMERVSAEAALKAKDSEEACEQMAVSMRQTQETWKKSLMAQGKSEASLTASYQAQVKAYHDLCVSLRSSTSAQATAQAFVAYRSALIEAYTKAGVEAESQMKAAEAASFAQLRFLSGVAQDVKLAIAKEDANFRARLREKCAESSLVRMGANQTELNSQSNLAVQLKANIQAANEVGAIATAFQNYQQASLNLVSNMFTSRGNTAAVSAMSSINSSVNGTSNGTARLALVASLSAAANPEAIVSAYQAYYAAANSAVQGASNSLGEANVSAGATVTISSSLYAAP